MTTKPRLWLLGLAMAPSLLSAQGGRGAAPPPAGGPGTPAPVVNTPLPPGSGAISGIVLDGSTGAAIADAVVYLSMASRPMPVPQSRQITDNKGRFAFVDLPPSPGFTISAGKVGYLDGGYGRESSPFDALRQIPLREGEWIPNVRITVWRPGAISGMVRDERGEPVVGVYVRALSRFRLHGRDQFAAGPTTTTDDRGAYRLAGLSPGQYVIQVPSSQTSIPRSLPYSPSGTSRSLEGAVDAEGTSTRLVIGRYPLPPPPVNGRSVVYPMAFHPAATAVSEATAIDLRFGDDRANVDVVLEPVATARVSGIVEGAPEALANLTLRLLPIGLEDVGLGAETATAFVESSGAFTFLNVPAGSYVIDAPRTIGEFRVGSGLGATLFPPPSRTGGWSSNGSPIDLLPRMTFTVTDYRSGAPNFYGRASVTVAGADTSTIVIPLRAPATMSGSIKIEFDPGRPAPASPPRFSPSADPANGSASLGSPRSQNSPDVPADQFSITGLLGGEYFLRVPAGAGWAIKSIQWKGREYLDVPFDAAAASDFSGIVVTMTNAAPIVTGAVRLSDASTPASATVLAFPANHDLWLNSGRAPTRFRSTAMTATGTYRFDTLPAGDYVIVAVSGTPTGMWRDPERLAALERTAKRMTFTWSTQTSQDLTLGQGR